jgi:hypothetical protein
VATVREKAELRRAATLPADLRDELPEAGLRAWALGHVDLWVHDGQIRVAVNADQVRETDLVIEEAGWLMARLYPPARGRRTTSGRPPR